MKRLLCIAGLILACAFGNAALAANPQAAGAAQAKPPVSQPKPTVSMVYDRLLSQVEKEVVDAAEAMPDEKFNFAPTSGEFKGVRTYAAQIKHIAAVNYLLGASLMQEKAPVDLGGEDGPTNITSKADVVKFLKDSFALGHRAAATLTTENMLLSAEGSKSCAMIPCRALASCKMICFCALPSNTPMRRSSACDTFGECMVAMTRWPVSAAVSAVAMAS